MNVFDLMDLLEIDSKHLGFDMTIANTKHGRTLLIWKRDPEGKGRVIMEEKEIHKEIKTWLNGGGHIDHPKRWNVAAWTKLYILLKEIFGDGYDPDEKH